MQWTLGVHEQPDANPSRTVRASGKIVSVYTAIDTSNCPSLTCNSSPIMFALCMSSSQVMCEQVMLQLHTQLFLGTPNLCRNIIVFRCLRGGVTICGPKERRDVHNAISGTFQRAL